jgi:hypothetical protein
MSTCKNI